MIQHNNCSCDAEYIDCIPLVDRIVRFFVMRVGGIAVEMHFTCTRDGAADSVLLLCYVVVTMATTVNHSARLSGNLRSRKIQLAVSLNRFLVYRT